MDDSTTSITVCYGGKLVIGEVWKYVEGSVAVVRVNINNLSYEDLEKDISKQLQCKVGKLHYQIPGKSLKDGSRYLYDDGVVRDLVYHFLHRHEVYVYVEPVGAEYEEIVLEAGIESEVGDRSVLEQGRISEDTEASLTARVLEISEQLEKSGGLANDEEETMPESSSRINLGS